MKLVQVLSYSGHKADESPRFLKLDDSTVPITQIEDRWYSPGETFFRILTPSGDRYLLRHVEAQDLWTLEGFRSHRIENSAGALGRTDTPSPGRKDLLVR
ncbi:MAG TPA: hypothetical protein VJX70_11425 [Candidatus Acidoferrum sp.]|nr:hypothetical protein [Candidatus Acidoferrum sp.]